jgi:3,4-dihydroxyphenylacetate 2,3-dioxygenase
MTDATTDVTTDVTTRSATGEIVGAGLVAHVPTMIMSEADRRELNDGNEGSLVSGIEALRRDVLDPLAHDPGIDTIIVFDTHWFTTFEFVITAHDRRTGKFTSDELPRGMSQVPYDFRGDPELARLIGVEAEGAGTWITPIDDPYLPVHYATINLLPFLQGCGGRDGSVESWVSVSIPQTGEPDDFLLAGEVIRRSIEQLDRKVVLLASGALSHKFWPLRALRDHEPSDPSHIRSDRHRAADLERLAWMAEGRHDRIIDTMDEFMTFTPEGRFGHYLMMVAALGGRDCTAAGRLFGEYESAVGTGQAHVWFDRPTGGWTGRPAEPSAQ